MKMTRVLALLILSLVAVPTAQAATIFLDAVDSGFYQRNNIGETGFHDPANQNYLTGQFDFTPTIITNRSFFVFDLSGVTDPILSATLQLENPIGGYSSPDPTESVRFFDITTPIATLLAGGSGLTSVYDDLGTGFSYLTAGSQLVDASLDGTVVDFSLGALAVLNLNSATGLFGIGGEIWPATIGPGTQFFFGGTSDSTGSAAAFTRRLRLETDSSTSGSTIPEPSTLLLAGLGLAGAAFKRKRA